MSKIMRAVHRVKCVKAADLIVALLIGLLLLAIVIAIVYPLWFIVISSFSDPAAVAEGRVSLLPVDITFSGYERIWHEPRIWRGYLNTLVYSVLGTGLNLVVTIPAAFALSRPEFRARRILLFAFAFTMFFSGGLIPSYLLYSHLGLLDSMWVFILPGALSVYNLIVARAFFESAIPEELFDAARVDGVSYFGYFFRVVLPLSAAIIAVIGLYYFVGHWNDFMTGLIFVTDDSKQPLQNVLQQLLLVNQNTSTTSIGVAEAQRAANQMKFGVILVSTLPLFVLYPCLQKYFNKGVMLGAVKG